MYLQTTPARPAVCLAKQKSLGKQQVREASKAACPTTPQTDSPTDQTTHTGGVQGFRSDYDRSSQRSRLRQAVQSLRPAEKSVELLESL